MKHKVVISAVIEHMHIHFSQLFYVSWLESGGKCKICLVVWSYLCLFIFIFTYCWPQESQTHDYFYVAFFYNQVFAGSDRSFLVLALFIGGPVSTNSYMINNNNRNESVLFIKTTM